MQTTSVLHYATEADINAFLDKAFNKMLGIMTITPKAQESCMCCGKPVYAHKMCKGCYMNYE